MNHPRSTPTQVRRNKSHVLLVFVSILFFGPLLLIAWVFFGNALTPAEQVIHGQLFTPAWPLPVVSLDMPGDTKTSAVFLQGKWSLIYITADTCEQRCQAALRDTRAVKEALGKARLQRVVLVDGACCARGWLTGERDDLVVGWLSSPQGRELLTAFPALAMPLETAGRIYLVNPQGNLVMSYPANVRAPVILGDLEGLLRASHDPPG